MESQFVVPGYSGRAIRVGSGSVIRIIDVEGTQICDMFALSAEEICQRLDRAVAALGRCPDRGVREGRGARVGA